MGWFQRFGFSRQEHRSPPAKHRPSPDDTGSGEPLHDAPSTAAGLGPGHAASGLSPGPPATRSGAPERSSPPFEKDNRGIRISRREQAEPYYQWRRNGAGTPGFLIYRFSREIDAFEALLALDGFHRAQDTGNLVCDIPLIFGWYRRSDGLWEVLMGGDSLTAGEWSLARQHLEKCGGRLIDQRRPHQNAPDAAATSISGDVVFAREYSEVDLTGTRRLKVFKAASAAAARTFLKQRESLPSDPSEVVRVESPEGVFHRDHTGLIEEIEMT